LGDERGKFFVFGGEVRHGFLKVEGEDEGGLIHCEISCLE
jgi:hypothetical protein